MTHKSIDSEKLIEFRMEKDETKAAVAKSMGITVKTLYRYEKGKVKRLDARTVQKLAEYYGVKISCFMYEEEEMIKKENE